LGGRRVYLVCDLANDVQYPSATFGHVPVVERSLSSVWSLHRLRVVRINALVLAGEEPPSASGEYGQTAMS
jgi:hypothetical protein